MTQVLDGPPIETVRPRRGPARARRPAPAPRRARAGAHARRGALLRLLRPAARQVDPCASLADVAQRGPHPPARRRQRRVSCGCAATRSIALPRSARHPRERVGLAPAGARGQRRVARGERRGQHARAAVEPPAPHAAAAGRHPARPQPVAQRPQRRLDLPGARAGRPDRQRPLARPLERAQRAAVLQRAPTSARAGTPAARAGPRARAATRRRSGRRSAASVSTSGGSSGSSVPARASSGSSSSGAGRVTRAPARAAPARRPSDSPPSRSR